MSDLESRYGETIRSQEKKILGQQRIHAEEIQALKKDHEGHNHFVQDKYQREYQRVAAEKGRLEERYEQLRAAYEKLKG